MISIPCGLSFYDREIELTLEPTDEWSMVNVYLGNVCIGRLDRVTEIDAAIEATLDYEWSIEDVGVERRD